MQGESRLILGDALEVLPTLGHVDAMIGDPPYGIGHRTDHGASWQGSQIAGDSDTSLRDFAVEWAEARGIPWAMFGSWKRQWPERARGVIVWDKGPAFGMGDLSFPWKMSWEGIAIGGKGWTGRRDEGVLRGHIVVSWESKGRVHPHEKPVSLIRALLVKLPHARTIVDPFMGSGTTGVAAAELGLSFVGIESDPACFAIAQGRVAAAGAQPLFPACR